METRAIRMFGCPDISTTPTGSLRTSVNSMLKIWMLVWWTQQSWMLIKLGNRWPRVKPGELDQTNGDFFTIVHQLNTWCPSGYVMRIHDIIAMRLYCYWLVSYFCPMIQYLCDIMTWYVIFQHSTLNPWLLSDSNFDIFLYSITTVSPFSGLHHFSQGHGFK